MSEEFLVEPAAPADLSAVIALMRALAEVEGNLAAFTATAERLGEGLFGSVPGLLCWVARSGNEVLGVALCATTWVGVTSRPSLRLLNLVVEHGNRRSGIGTRLLAAVAGKCAEFDCPLDFMVRTENTAAQDFYRRLGARSRDEWQPWQLPRDALQELRSGLPPSSGRAELLDAGEERG
jgi:ribosomal protein S18 acetylase RimI-like enzyme